MPSTIQPTGPYVDQALTRAGPFSQVGSVVPPKVVEPSQLLVYHDGYAEVAGPFPARDRLPGTPTAWAAGRDVYKNNGAVGQDYLKNPGAIIS